MIALLARIFIKNRSCTDDPAVRRAYGILCSAVGIALNLLLFASKYAAGVFTGSIAAVADAFNNLSDAASSLVTLLGFKISAKRRDSEHPFGHGRAEYIAGLIVSMLIILMGFSLGRDSIEKIISPAPLRFSPLSAVILGASVLVKLYMAFYNRRTGRRIRSAAMRATAADSLSDAIATLAVLISMLVNRFTGVNIDPYAGVLVSLLIFKAGYGAAKETISPLLGNAPDPKFVRQVMEIVNAYEGVKHAHDLIVHDYGPGRTMLSLHVEVPGNRDVMSLHDMIDDIEQRLSSELDCQAIIHMDPVNSNDKSSRLRRRLQNSLRQNLHPDISIHDLRIISGKERTILKFDAVVPLQSGRSDAELQEEIIRLVHEMDENYSADVTIDHPFEGGAE